MPAHTHTHACTHTHAHAHTHMHTRTHTHTHTHTHTAEYEDLRQWSTEHYDNFWEEFFHFSGIKHSTPYSEVVTCTPFRTAGAAWQCSYTNQRECLLLAEIVALQCSGSFPFVCSRRRLVLVQGCPDSVILYLGTNYCIARNFRKLVKNTIFTANTFAECSFVPC